MTRRRALLAGLGLLLVGGFALGVSFVRSPFWWFERLGKMALGRAGLQRESLDTPRGPLVSWRGGSGPTVVLVHGANDTAAAWSRVARPLAASFRVVALDLPGHGESGPAGGPLPASHLVAGVEAIVEAEGRNSPVTLVGNSLGGFLAMMAASRHPERVAHVVLLNGAAIRSEPGAAISLLPRSREEALAALAALTAPGTPPAPGFVLDDLVRRGPTSPIARMEQAGVDPAISLDGRLGSFATPVSLVWGDADRLMPVSYAEVVRSQLPSARLEVIAGCGHVPQRECPEKTVSALTRVLREPPPRAAAGGPASAGEPVQVSAPPPAAR